MLTSPKPQSKFFYFWKREVISDLLNLFVTPSVPMEIDPWCMRIDYFRITILKNIEFINLYHTQVNWVLITGLNLSELNKERL